MTNFKKENFYFDGSFLTYNGDYEGAMTMEQHNPNCHPSWVGKIKPAFIARFKYGRKPYKSWINFLVKNATVEEYLQLANEHTPLHAMRMLGFKK